MKNEPLWSADLPPRSPRGAMRWETRRQDGTKKKAAGSEETTARSERLRKLIGVISDPGHLENRIKDRDDNMEVRDDVNLSFFENRRREGELDGNTVYWEYKKG